MKTHTYFLGGSSPSGFRTSFGRIIGDTDYHTYIIKGGPGTGKSSLMKRIFAEFGDEDRDLYLCSSDPDSADAVVLKKHKVIFVDGTAPHVFDPEYPGAVQEILNMGDCWDAEALRSAKEGIIGVTADYSRYHVHCRRYISAAASVLEDTKHIAGNAVNYDKLDGFIFRTAKKLLPMKGDIEGNLCFRQLSAITPKGYMTLIPENDEVYILKDNYFAGSDYFLKSFSDAALQKGYDVDISICNVFEEEYFEHMRIPELGMSFISSNAVNKTEAEKAISVNFMRFYNKAEINGKKNRLKFNISAAEELLDEAVNSLKNAKAYHDKLEEFYINAVDFGKTEEIFKAVTEKIRG